MVARISVAAAVVAGVLLSAWSTPAWGDLSCQSELKQGTNCLELIGPATNPIYLAVSCQACTKNGSNYTCTPGEAATAAGLAIKDAANQVMPGGFVATGVTCDLGVPLFKFTGNLPPGPYIATVTGASDPEQTLFSFTLGGTPAADGQPPISGDRTTTGADAGGNPPRTEAGLPISLDAKRFDERGNPIGGSGGGTDDGCSCAVTAGRLPLPRIPLLVLFAVVLALRRGRRGSKQHHD